MKDRSQHASAPDNVENKGRGWWLRIGRSILGTPSVSRSPNDPLPPPSSSKTSAVQPPAANLADRRGSRDPILVAGRATRGDGGTIRTSPPRRRTAPTTSPGSLEARRSPSKKKGGARQGVERARYAQQLAGALPLIWRFLRECEGWSFVNQSSWDVCRPRRGDDTDVVKPLSQSQVSVLLVYIVLSLFVVLKTGGTHRA